MARLPMKKIQQTQLYVLPTILSQSSASVLAMDLGELCMNLMINYLVVVLIMFVIPVESPPTFSFFYHQFQFVEYYKLQKKYCETFEPAFALSCLMEIPDQYKAIKKLGLLDPHWDSNSSHIILLRILIFSFRVYFFYFVCRYLCILFGLSTNPLD